MEAAQRYLPEGTVQSTKGGQDMAGREFSAHRQFMREAQLSSSQLPQEGSHSSEAGKGSRVTQGSGRGPGILWRLGRALVSGTGGAKQVLTISVRGGIRSLVVVYAVGQDAVGSVSFVGKGHQQGVAHLCLDDGAFE